MDENYRGLSRTALKFCVLLISVEKYWKVEVFSIIWKYFFFRILQNLVYLDE